MEDNIDLNKLWAQQSVSPLDSKDLQVKFSELKRTEIKKLITVNGIMLFTIVYIICLTIYFQPSSITTMIGVVLTVISIITYSIVYNKFIPNSIKTTVNQNNKAFLTSLLDINNRRKQYQTKLLQFYFVTLTLGIGLYLYEYLVLLPVLWQMVCYSVLLIWVGFNWFYLGPKIISKEQDNYNEIIREIERVLGQK